MKAFQEKTDFDFNTLKFKNFNVGDSDSDLILFIQSHHDESDRVMDDHENIPNLKGLGILGSNGDFFYSRESKIVHATCTVSSDEKEKKNTINVFFDSIGNHILSDEEKTIKYIKTNYGFLFLTKISFVYDDETHLGITVDCVDSNFVDEYLSYYLNCTKEIFNEPKEQSEAERLKDIIRKRTE